MANTFKSSSVTLFLVNFGHVQIHLKIEGNLKIVVYYTKIH